MGMQVDRDPHALFERLDQLVAGKRLQKTCHILDSQDMGTHLLQLFRHADVVFKRVLVPLRVGDIAGITDGSLADLAALAHRFHGHLHSGGPVQRIKHAEDVDSGVGGLFNEFLDYVIRVVCVANGIGTAQEHLKQDVWDRFGQLVQALPRVLFEKPHGHIEGGPAPAFKREQFGTKVGGRLGDFKNIMTADAGRQIRLVGVTHGGVGDQQFLLLENPAGKPFRTELHEQVLAAERPRPCAVDLRNPGFNQFG